MATITSLCNKSILLDAGRLINYDKTSDIVLTYYLQGKPSPASFDYSSSTKSTGDGQASLILGMVVDKNSKPSSEIDICEQLRIIMKYEVERAGEYVPNYHIFSSDGTYAFVSDPQIIEIASPGIYQSECVIPEIFLNDDTYFLGLALSSFQSGIKVHFYEQNVLSFNIKEPIENVPTRRGYNGPLSGVFRPLLNWTIRRMS